MGYSSNRWSFSVALIAALCCQSTKSQQRPSDPESDVNCIRVESVTKYNSRWDSGDRVFICHTSGDQFDIFSYEKNEEVASFTSHNIVLKEQWALSIRFRVYSAGSGSRYQCTFSQIEHAQAFYAKVNPRSRLSPQNFSVHRLDSCLVLRGKCQNRTFTNDRLIFHQHFIDSRTTLFTFEPADGSEANGTSLLTFLQGEFQVHRSNYTEVVLANRNNRSLYYILYADDHETTDKFFDYITEFVDVEFEYTFTVPDL